MNRWMGSWGQGRWQAGSPRTRSSEFYDLHVTDPDQVRDEPDHVVGSVNSRIGANVAGSVRTRRSSSRRSGIYQVR